MTRIYFIANHDATEVKIGVSNDPRQRLSALQVGTTHRLSLVGEMPGDERYEAILHDRFADWRISGEWFSFTGDLLQLVRSLPAMPDGDGRPPRARARAAQRAIAASQVPEDARRRIELRDEMYRLYKEAVINEIGLQRFADEVGARTYMVVHAINRMHGRRFPIHWIHGFQLASYETRRRLCDHTLRMCGGDGLDEVTASDPREAYP